MKKVVQKNRNAQIIQIVQSVGIAFVIVIIIVTHSLPPLSIYVASQPAQLISAWNYFSTHE